MQFADLAHARSRLRGTINTVDKKYYFFEDVNPPSRTSSSPTAVAYPLGSIRSGREEHLELDNVKIKAPTISLGWMNLESMTGFVLRRPTRGQGTQMGIVPRNTIVQSPSANFTLAGHTGLNGHLNDQGFLDYIGGIFPSFDDILGKSETKAFDRNFALRPATMRAWNLYHSRDLVGEFNTTTCKFELYEQYKYLKERLTRALAGKGVDKKYVVE